MGGKRRQRWHGTKARELFRFGMYTDAFWASGLVNPDGTAVTKRKGLKTLVDCVQSGGMDKDLEMSVLPHSHDEGYFATLLCQAVDSNLPELVSALLARGADPNRGLAVDAPSSHKEHDYSRPLRKATESEAMTRMLVAAGADVNLLSCGGTILYGAATSKDPRVVRVLLEAGADSMVDSGGFGTPMMAALHRGHPDTVELLREAGAGIIEKEKARPYSCRAGTKKLNTRTSRGVSTFVKPWLDAETSWVVTIVKADVEQTSTALRKRYRGSRLVTNVNEHVADMSRTIFVFGLDAMPWSVAIEDVGERRSLGDLGRKSAISVSKQLGCDVISFETWSAELYRHGKRQEKHDWNPYEAIEAGDPSDRQLAAIEKQHLKRMDSWFRGQDVLLPGVHIKANGYTRTLELKGINRSDLTRVDVVIV